MTPSPDDLHWMKFAYSLAAHAAARDEVPVGAILVADDKIVASGFNLRETLRQPTAHAELLAIEEACRIRQSWRLNDCHLYVTLEPCLMCAGAIYQARVKQVFFGAYDPKGGALGSLFQLNADQRLNHRYPVIGGVMQEECSAQLRSFFAKRRQEKVLPAEREQMPEEQDENRGDDERP